MQMFFDCFNDDPQFFTMACILGGAFLVGVFYFDKAEKEYERQAASDWEEISNTFADLTRMTEAHSVQVERPIRTRTDRR